MKRLNDAGEEWAQRDSPSLLSFAGNSNGDKRAECEYHTELFFAEGARSECER